MIRRVDAPHAGVEGRLAGLDGRGRPISLGWSCAGASGSSGCTAASSAAAAAAAASRLLRLLVQPMQMGGGAFVPLDGPGRTIVHLDQRVDPLGVGAQLLQTEGSDLIPRMTGEDGQALLGVGDGHCKYI